MVQVEIRGKQFPLCLTVAALDEVNGKCGGLSGIPKFLDGNENGKSDSSRAICNTAWMLALLIQEGEENRLIMARFDGEQAERRDVPDEETVRHLLTMSSARKYRAAVYEAVTESMTQEIEALYPKNGESAGRE